MKTLFQKFGSALWLLCLSFMSVLFAPFKIILRGCFNWHFHPPRLHLIEIGRWFSVLLRHLNISLLRRGGLAALYLILFCVALFTAPNARAMLETFQFTNIVPAGLSITSYPTNTPTTNYWSAGTTPSTTNLYFLNWLTGKALNVQNYNTVGFDFKCNYTSSNAAVVAFGLVRASGPAGVGGNPVLLINTNNSVLWANDYETAVAPNNWILIPLAAGTNVAFNWRTNLDVSSTDFVGIYQETNSISTIPGTGLSGAIGWMSNNVVSINKKIIPFSLNGGNF